MLENEGPFRWLIPGVLAGGRHPARCDRVEQATLFSTFDAVVTAFEEPLGPRLLDPWGARALHLRTADGEAPDLVRACSFLDEAHAAGHATLVHCWAGIGRTGTILAAWLLHTGQAPTADAARDRVRAEYHADALETRTQEQALAAFAARLARGRSRR